MRARADHLLDRGEHQRRPGREQRGELSRAREQILGGHDLVDEAPALRLQGLQPAAGEQQLHGDVIRDPAGQLDGRGIGELARLDLGQGKARVRGRDDQVGREGELEAAADRHAAHRGDHGLAQARQLLQAAEAADPEIGIRGLAGGRRLEVPAGREEALAGTGHDRDPQLRVVAEGREGFAQRAAGRGVDRVRLGPVEHDLEDRAIAPDVENLAHATSSLAGAGTSRGAARRISASAATTPWPTA